MTLRYDVLAPFVLIRTSHHFPGVVIPIPVRAGIGIGLDGIDGSQTGNHVESLIGFGEDALSARFGFGSGAFGCVDHVVVVVFKGFF